MDLRLLRLFLSLVHDQGRFALDGARRLQLAVDPLQRGERADMSELWIGAQQLLVGAGNVSKALWGAGGRLAAVRQPVREALHVRDDSPLRVPSVRNDWEHMDERIDRWATSGSNVFMDSSIGQASLLGFPPESVFRHFDPATEMLTFWSNELPIRDVVGELERITPLAEAIFTGREELPPVD